MQRSNSLTPQYSPMFAAIKIYSLVPKLTAKIMRHDAYILQIIEDNNQPTAYGFIAEQLNNTHDTCHILYNSQIKNSLKRLTDKSLLAVIEVIHISRLRKRWLITPKGKRLLKELNQKVIDSLNK